MAKKSDRSWALQEVTRSSTAMHGATTDYSRFRFVRVTATNVGGFVIQVEPAPGSRKEKVAGATRLWRVSNMQPEVSTFHGTEWDTLDEAKDALRPYRNGGAK